MKHLSLTALVCMCISFFASAAPKYWVGPLNGNWSNSANWSATMNGPGGVEPSITDDVYFTPNSRSLVHMDVTPTINSLNISGDVTLHADLSGALFILRSMSIPVGATLKDSTSLNNGFRVILVGGYSATASINGTWIFEGGVPVSEGNGAAFETGNGTFVRVGSASAENPAQLIFKKNSGNIKSTDASLFFELNSRYVLDNKSDAYIPAATWAVQYPENSAIVIVQGNIKKLTVGKPNLVCGRVIFNLDGLDADLNLNLPASSQIDGNFEINNTNGHTVTLLDNSSLFAGMQINGNLIINGNDTKVALASASPQSPSSSFYLTVKGDFVQSDGNFSLQDFDGASGSSTIQIVNNLNENGGTFHTNSNSTSATARFVVYMSDPEYRPVVPNAFSSQRNLFVKSGSIDNSTHKVTLKIEHSTYLQKGNEYFPNGVMLQLPLQVGRLELLRGTLTTDQSTILTVNDPSPDAITLGTPSNSADNGLTLGPNATSYVNGPIRRATNSTQPYFFPTGKGNFLNNSNFNFFIDSFTYDSCYIIPASSEPSVYQAEYFKKGYPDMNVTAPLTGISNAEYWDFKKISGSDASVKFKLTKPAVVTGGSNTLVAARYENGHWISAQGSVISICAVTDSFIVSKPLSTLGQFTFGYLRDAGNMSVPDNLTPGLAYNFYKGNFETLPDFNALTPVTSGTSNNVDISIRPADTDYNYAVKWEGYIKIATPGDYTFETISDDGSKVYFDLPYCKNAASLVNNDGVHGPVSASGTIKVPAAGVYPVTVTFFQQSSGQTMQLYWTGPGISRRPIPDSLFSNAGVSTPPPQTGSGLNYKFYQGSFDALPDFSTLTPVKTGTSANVDINVRPAGINDNFAFTWDGTIIIPTTGTYTFETVSDDGSKLVLNGNIVVLNDGLHASKSASGTISLPAGNYPLAINFFEKDGGETMQVYWSGPGIARQLIPDAAFGSGTITPPPATGSGLNYKFYQGDYNMLPDFNTLIPVKTGISANADINVRPFGVNDHFGFVWEGTINLPAAGTYTFETVSDDGSSVYVNGSRIVNNDGLHPAISSTGIITVPSAGAYPIRINYFEKDGSETMQLYWSGPGIPRQLIPNAVFSTQPPPVNSSGLNYKYFEGNSDILPDFSSLIPVRTGTSANVDISVRTQGVNDYFAFIWTGYVNLPSAGTYTFETISDDGSKVYFNMPYSFNGTSTVNNDGLHAATSVAGTVTVPSAGRYPITITYFEKNGRETMQLYWSGPGISRQLIPDDAFTTTNNIAGDIAIMSGLQYGTLNSATAAIGTKVYPNPFVESFSIDYFHSGSAGNKVIILVYDLNGKLVFSYQPSNLQPGLNRWLINLRAKNLTPGIYMAQVILDGAPAKSIKLVKIKKID